MLTIIDAEIAHGYSGHDHLIDQRPIRDEIGTRHRSVGDCRRHLDRVVTRTQDVRVTCAPVRFTVRFADGTKREIAP